MEGGVFVGEDADAVPDDKSVVSAVLAEVEADASIPVLGSGRPRVQLGLEASLPRSRMDPESARRELDRRNRKRSI